MQAALLHLEGEVTCPVCLEEFRDPRCLPCQHTLCLSCLKRLHSANSKLLCPTCRQPVHTQSVASFPVCHKTTSMQEALQKLRGTGAIQNRSFIDHCADCSELVEILPCPHCSKLLCDSCVENHRTLLINQYRQTCQAAYQRMDEYEKERANQRTEFQTRRNQVNKDFEEIGFKLTQIKASILHSLEVESKKGSVNPDDLRNFKTHLERVSDEKNLSSNSTSISDLMEAISAVYYFTQHLGMNDTTNDSSNEAHVQAQQSNQNGQLLLLADVNFETIMIKVESIKKQISSFFEIQRKGTSSIEKVNSNSHLTPELCTSNPITNTSSNKQASAVSNLSVQMKQLSLSMSRESSYSFRTEGPRNPAVISYKPGDNPIIYAVKVGPPGANKLDVYSAQGRKIRVERMTTPQGLFNPYQCSFDAKKQLLVVTDFIHHSIGLFNSDGDCVLVGPEIKTDSFKNPRGITSDGNHIYVGCNKSVFVMDFETLSIVSEITFPGKDKIIDRIGVSETQIFAASREVRTRHQILVVDKVSHQIVSTIAEKNLPVASLAYNTDRQCLVVLWFDDKRYNHVICCYDNQLKLSARIHTISLQLEDPFNLCFTDNSHLAVCDRSSKTIVVFAIQ